MNVSGCMALNPRAKLSSKGFAPPLYILWQERVNGVSPANSACVRSDSEINKSFIDEERKIKRERKPELQMSINCK